MAAPERLQAQQAEFAAHLRDPQHAPPPGIEERRLRVYRDLFYNSLQNLLAGNFPVIRKVLGDAAWHGLVRDFYREYRCSTPLFPELPREFIQYLGQRAAADRGDPPWLPELAHYEWVELALDFSEADPGQMEFDPEGDLLAGVPLPSPLAWALAYGWPVQRISPTFLPDEAPAQATFLLVRRDATRRVRFDEISALTFRLLQRLSEDEGTSGRGHLLALAAEAQAEDTEAFLASGRDMLQRLRAEGVLLGTAR